MNLSHPSGWSEALALLRTLVFFLVLVVLLRASVVEAFRIPSQSMETTLQVGDHILVNKLSYGVRAPFVEKMLWRYATPQRGDVVVFTLPDNEETADTNESDTNLIKRIIGLPGDTIEVRGVELFINGELLEENYSRYLEGGTTDFGPVKVPEGHVLLLGDNRDHSKDSRFWNSPFLDIRRIKGRAFIVYWNFDDLFNRMFVIIR